MITISEKTIATWFLPTTKGQDFMGSLFRNDEGHLQFTYRFRYYAEENNPAWDEKDEKHWYDVIDKEGKTPEEMLQILRQMLKVMETVAVGKLDQILMVNGDVNKFIEEMAAKPWAHMRVMPQDGNKRVWNVEKRGNA